MRSPRWMIFRTLEKALAAAILAGVLFHFSSAWAGTWHEHAVKLSYLAHEIKVFEGEIKDLVEQKKKTRDHKQIKELVDRLAKKHAELSRASRDYEAERLHVRFNHPEKNDEAERQYVRYDLRPLVDMEESSGIEGRLNHIKSRVLATFPVPPKQESEEMKNFRTQRKPASVEDEDAPERIRLSK
jgi:hypothetical protein